MAALFLGFRPHSLAPMLIEEALDEANGRIPDESDTGNAPGQSGDKKWKRAKHNGVSAAHVLAPALHSVLFTRALDFVSEEMRIRFAEEKSAIGQSDAEVASSKAIRCVDTVRGVAMHAAAEAADVAAINAIAASFPSADAPSDNDGGSVWIPEVHMASLLFASSNAASFGVGLVTNFCFPLCSVGDAVPSPSSLKSFFINHKAMSDVKVQDLAAGSTAALEALSAWKKTKNSDSGVDNAERDWRLGVAVGFLSFLLWRSRSLQNGIAPAVSGADHAGSLPLHIIADAGVADLSSVRRGEEKDGSCAYAEEWQQMLLDSKYSLTADPSDSQQWPLLLSIVLCYSDPSAHLVENDVGLSPFEIALSRAGGILNSAAERKRERDVRRRAKADLPYWEEVLEGMQDATLLSVEEKIEMYVCVFLFPPSECGARAFFEFFVFFLKRLGRHVPQYRLSRIQKRTTVTQSRKRGLLLISWVYQLRQMRVWPLAMQLP